jgi:pimeloyl-ACP methyl ester carboxylesterase
MPDAVTLVHLFSAPASTSRRGLGGRPPRRSTSPVRMSNAPAAKLAWIPTTVLIGRVDGRDVLRAAPSGFLIDGRNDEQTIETRTGLRKSFGPVVISEASLNRSRDGFWRARDSQMPGVSTDAVFRISLHEDFRADIAKIDMPTLVMHGDAELLKFLGAKASSAEKAA